MKSAKASILQDHEQVYPDRIISRHLHVFGSILIFIYIRGE